MKVLNFGSLNVDYVYTVDHMVQGGETLNTSKMDIFLGGKGFNQSAALAKAGAAVYHAGQIGDDGLNFLEACQEYGIHSDYIRKCIGKSGHTIIQVDKKGQNCILLYGGSNRTITEEFVNEVLSNFEEGDFLILQNEINLLPYIIDVAYKKGMVIVLNPSPMDDNLLSCDLSKVSYFLLNEIEGAQITGETDLAKIPEKLLDLYPDAKIVLTLGHNGSVYVDKCQTIPQGIYKVETVDTTAAGDTFTGYFISEIISGKSISCALEIAAKASAITVTRKGAAPSIPYRNEVENTNFF